MLMRLVINNYALIEHMEMEPVAGLNVITGETGAGKSILLGAVGLLLGERADRRVLMTDTDKCIVEATFNLSAYGLEPFFQENDLDYQPISIIRREINTSGKSRAFVNDTPVNLDLLRQLTSRLLDIHSQHDHLQLSEAGFQINLLDTFANNISLLQQYQLLYHTHLQQQKAYQALQQRIEAQAQQRDYEYFLWQELEKARLQSDEQQQLEEQLERLENAESIRQALAEAFQLLDDENHGIDTLLQHLVGLMRRLQGFGEHYHLLYERAESLQIELRELARDLAHAAEEVEADPKQLVRLRERLDLIYNLQRKHKVDTVQALLERQATLAQGLAQGDSWQQELKQLAEQLASQHKQLEEMAQQLHEKRKQAAELLASLLQKMLTEMAMPQAKILFDITQQSTLNQFGCSRVELLFSANLGLSPQPLRMVASGGEFARLMLAVKYLLAQKKALPTLILDEIDTGISGETAMRIAHLMQEMGQYHQIIAISHLHQIAAVADAHYYVYKQESEGRTYSRLRLLSKEERLQEIAQMIGGGVPSAAALQSARELMQQKQR